MLSGSGPYKSKVVWVRYLSQLLDFLNIISSNFYRYQSAYLLDTSTSHFSSHLFIMVPGILYDTSPDHTISPSKLIKSGQALEETSDCVDEVNVLKDSIKQDKTQFRHYEDACDRVKDFYLEQHTKQTVAYNLRARNRFKSKVRAEMTVWEAIEKLNTLIDESDPDTSLSQIEHLLQSAEAIRRDGKARWFQLTGLIHDLGKLLYFYDAEGQWDVVGDTFPVGCAFDRRIIYPNTFTQNPDSKDPIYSTEHGIYTPDCGM